MQWVQHKLVDPLAQLPLSERVTAVAVGIIGGMFPIPALTTVATVGMAKVISISAPQFMVACAVNLLVTPLEVAMIPFFAVGGAAMMGADSTNFTAAHLLAAMENGLSALLRDALAMLIHAALCWTVLATFTAFCLTLVRK